MLILPAGNWLCFFNFHIAARSTLNENIGYIRRCSVQACFFKSVWEYAQANHYMALMATLHWDIAFVSLDQFVRIP
jgi:hypothetical protein